MSSAVVSPPTITDGVNQQFFIQSLGGADTTRSYLDIFPPTVYATTIDSALVKFLYALLGPVGAGYLRSEYLKARLQFEEAGLTTVDLDGLYGNPFAFARLLEETYDLDASAALLTSDERALVESSDASYRNRAINYLQAVRAGGTALGMTLAAQSGLNRPVEVVENYRALYDQHSDAPLGLPLLGATTQTNEIIVVPRQVTPQNAIQTISFRTTPVTGWFTLTYPAGSNYNIMQASVTSGSSTVTLPTTQSVQVGCYIVINGVIAVVSQILSSTQVATAYPLTSASATANPPGSGGTPGAPVNFAFTGTYSALVGYAETYGLPYNATATQVQTALNSLPSMGGANVLCSGGPLPAQPIQVEFVNALSDSRVQTLQINATSVAGVNVFGTANSAQQLTDIANQPVTGLVTTDIVGQTSGAQVMAIAPADEYAMQTALDHLRPQTAIVTTITAPSTTSRQVPNAIFGGSTYTEVVRYATGTSHVAWPTVDALHWIEQGVEHEAPRPVNTLAHHYAGFHNLVSAISYTDLALGDPQYGNPQGRSQPLWVTYYDQHIGPYSSAQVALYPFLKPFTDTDRQFPSSDALATTPEPLAITDTVNGVGVVNGVYPKDYLSLPGVKLSLGNHNRFWSSLERVAGTDYLEIDLGVVQAVNFLYFEAARKPFVIDVAYDVLDQAPSRRFVAATLLSTSLAPSTTSLSYDATAISPWEPVGIHCTNALGQVIFTRFVRIGFTRSPGRSPLASIPYSIEVRNLRVGRNVS